MEKKTKFDVMRPLIDEAFNKGECFTFTPNGVSMRPFIKGGKTAVTIKRYTSGLNKHDIIFYVRDDDKYVMHRIVKIYPDSFGVCGDNQWWIEKVYDRQIFAIVTSIEGKTLPGGFIYLNTLPIRRFIIHIIEYIKRCFGGKK